MSYLDTAYKLGAAHAIDSFTDWVTTSDDNPTEAPRNKFAANLAVKRALEKLGEPKGQKVKPGSRKGGKSEPAARAPAGKGTRFNALKNKLKRQKKVKNPGALAAAIGRSKFGKNKMQAMAKKGGLEQPDQPRAREVIPGRGPEKREAREMLRQKLRETCPLAAKK